MKEYKNENKKDIYKEIRLNKPIIHIHTAYINFKGKLVIITDDEKDKENIEKPWSETAFKSGLKILENKKRIFAIIKHVSKNIKSNELRDSLSTEYNVTSVLRMLNKDKSDSYTVRIELKDSTNLDHLICNGLYHEEEHYRVTEWKNKNIICFKCQKLGHKSTECKGKDVCARCAGSHKTSECKSIEKNNEIKIISKCSRCNKTDHAAWDPNYPKLINSLLQLNPRTPYSQIVKQKSLKQPNYNKRTNQIGDTNLNDITEQLNQAKATIEEKDEKISMLTKKITAIEITLNQLLKRCEESQIRGTTQNTPNTATTSNKQS